MFSFLGDCTPTHSTQENEVVTCTVVRNRGDDGEVNVTWAVFQSGTTVRADEDFVNSSGLLSFTAGERTKVKKISVVTRLNGLEIIDFKMVYLTCM